MPRIPPGTRIDSYEVERWLGGGGMGDVYLATDTTLATRVAMKVIKADVDSEETRQRFLKEARLVAALRNHPNIVPIYQFGEYELRPFFTMEYIEGRSLADFIKEGAPPLTTRLRWLEELCQGLHFAHEHGVIHRDIKPANLMIDELGRLRVLDFGIARIADATRTQLRLEGTIPYMAPEAVRGEGSDRRVDVFSAAAVAYELLTLSRAFQGDTEATLIYNVVSTAPRSFREFSAAGLDADLEDIVFKGLHKKPEARYATAAELGGALGQVRQRLEQGTAPVDPDPFKSTVRVVRDEPQPVAVTRYRLLAGVLALAAVVLAILIYFQITSSRNPETIAGVGTELVNPQPAPDPPNVESPAPVPSPPRSETTEVSAPSRAQPAPAEPKPIPSTPTPATLPPAQPVSVPAPVPALPAPTPDPIDIFDDGTRLPSDTAHPGLLVRMLRESANGQAQLVDPDAHVFRTGDGFRFAFMSNIDGFLYVAKETRDKSWQVLFPDPAFNDGSNFINRNRMVVLPGPKSDDWYEMLEPRPLSGLERVFVLLSRTPTDVLPRLNTPVRDSQMLALADIDKAMSTVATRDIGRRKSIPTSTSGPQSAQSGTYVVNVSDGDAVVLRFEMKHAAPDKSQ